MSNSLSLSEGEPPVLSPSPFKTLSIKVARHVSNILSPIAVSLPAVLLVALYKESNQALAALNTCITLLFVSIGPMVYILIGVKTGKFSDVDVSQRSQRSGPFLFGIMSSFIGLITLAIFHGPKNLQTVLLITVVGGIILMITTFWWKISIHAASLAGTVTVLTALYGAVVLPAYSLVVLVGWSRVVLRRHTLGQVIAGSLASITLCSIIMIIRGN